MMDWLRDNIWAAWLTAAAVLGLAELASLDFTLLMLAAGALTAAGVAAIFPGLLWLQIVVGLITAAAMLAAIRPLLARKFHHGGELKTGSAHVIGRTGTVVKEIHPDGGGSIRIGGDLWTARPFDEVSTIAPGTRVEIMAIDGATAVVYPVGDSLHQLPNPQPTHQDPKPTDPPPS
ncbi:NfeD family protein [Kribbella sp. NPDC050820]|uniref:NfeD family protein n=1 Tax=Kribbella sp. NPDC050820 TaxID=3155408 RepID=UPI003411CB80